MNQACRE